MGKSHGREVVGTLENSYAFPLGMISNEEQELQTARSRISVPVYLVLRNSNTVRLNNCSPTHYNLFILTEKMVFKTNEKVYLDKKERKKKQAVISSLVLFCFFQLNFKEKFDHLRSEWCYDSLSVL